MIGHDARGFSLIEVMIAIVILTVGLLSLAQMMMIATNSNALSGRMTSSAALAKEQLERLKAVPFYSDPQNFVRNNLLLDGGNIDDQAAAQVNYVAYFDMDGSPLASPGDSLFQVRWQIRTINPRFGLLSNEMIRIDVRCMAAAGSQDQFGIIGEARYTVFRTANVS